MLKNLAKYRKTANGLALKFVKLVMSSIYVRDSQGNFQALPQSMKKDLRGLRNNYLLAA